MALVLFLIVLGVMWVAGKRSKKMQKKLQKTIDETFWNGKILSFNIQCFLDCIVVGTQLRLFMAASPHANSEELIAALLLFIFINALCVAIIIIIIKKKDTLFTKEVQNKFGRLYAKPANKHHNLALFKLPVTIWHRLVYMVMAGLFYQQPYFSIQLVVFFSLGFTSFRIVCKVDQPFKNQVVQQFQEIGCHMALVLLFLYTDFVTNPDA